jgi:hypothetical protein
MSIGEILPAVHSLGPAEKLQLIRILAEDLTGAGPAALQQVAGALPVWTPHGAFEGADLLLSALQADDQRVSAHA